MKIKKTTLVALIAVVIILIAAGVYFFYPLEAAEPDDEDETEQPCINVQLYAAGDGNTVLVGTNEIIIPICALSENVDAQSVFDPILDKIVKVYYQDGGQWKYWPTIESLNITANGTYWVDVDEDCVFLIW